MDIEETLEFRSYLCLARICGTLGGDNLGSDWYYDDHGYYDWHLAELHGTDIDRIFESQQVTSVFGSRRWAFTDPESHVGDDLEARLFHYGDHDLYYLVNRPTESRVDNITNAMTAVGMGVPDKFKQMAQLIELVRPEFRDKVVLSGYSLGGGLSAYAAIQSPWPVRTIVYDPLGLNRTMLGARGSGLLRRKEVLSDRFRHTDSYVDWYYIAGSWVAELNVKRNLSSIGHVTELPSDPVRAEQTNSHDLRHVRYGLYKMWHEHGWRGSTSIEPRV